MNEYKVTWEIPSIRRTHVEILDVMGIDEIFARYRMRMPEAFFESVCTLKKGESVTFAFPKTTDKITVTALEDIQPPPF